MFEKSGHRVRVKRDCSTVLIGGNIELDRPIHSGATICTRKSEKEGRREAGKSRGWFDFN